MMVTRLLLSFALPAALLGLIASPSPATMLPDRTVDDRTSEIAEIAQGLERGDVASNWNLSTRLEEMGPDIAPILEKALPAAGEKARLVFGKALIGLDRKAAGIRVMKDLVLAGKDLEVRRSAAKLIENLGDSTDHRALKKKLQSISDPYVKISLAKALARPPIWDRKAIRILKDYLEFDDFSVRCEAAIALAEIDDMDSGKSPLEQIRYEPSPRGRLADQLLKMDGMLDTVERVSGLEKDDFVKKQADEIKFLEAEVKRLEKAGPGEPLIEEIHGEIVRLSFLAEVEYTAHLQVSDPDQTAYDSETKEVIVFGYLSRSVRSSEYVEGEMELEVDASVPAASTTEAPLVTNPERPLPNAGDQLGLARRSADGYFETLCHAWVAARVLWTSGGCQDPARNHYLLAHLEPRNLICLFTGLFRFIEEGVFHRAKFASGRRNRSSA